MILLTDTTGTPVHILLVEDNPDHADLIIHGLRSNGIYSTVHHVSDGEQALDYLFGRGAYTNAGEHPGPALVLLDLRLPRIDGLDVLKTIKGTPALSRIPVVVLTSSDSEADLSKSYGYHANSYVIKPLNFRDFNQMMKDIGSYWLAWNRNLPAYR